RPTMSPSATSRLACDNATKAPKLRETSFASSSMLDLRVAAATQVRRDAPRQLDQPAGREARQQQDDAAVEGIGEAGAAAAEQAVGGGLERHQDDGAEQRSGQGANTAQGRGDHQLDRREDTEAAFGIDEADHQRVERARDRGEAGAEQQGIELV